MELFWKVSAAMLLCVILVLSVGKQERDISIVLTIAMCCMTGMVALSFMEPLLDFLQELQAMTQLDGTLLDVLIKVLGIGLVSEIVGTVCADAGCGSLGRSLQFLASAVMLHLAVPLFQNLLSIIREILGVL